jgi:hypothetical protein
VNLRKKYIYFSRKKLDWIPWEEKYLAKSKCYGYKYHLMGKVTISFTTNILNPVKDAEKIKIQELNKDAYSGLILGINNTMSAGKAAFSYVRGTNLVDYDDSNAKVAFPDERTSTHRRWHHLWPRPTGFPTKPN